MEGKIIKKPAFTAVGLKWSGTFAQAGAGEIKKVIEQMGQRQHEVEQIVNPDILLAISNVDRPDGFTIFIASEVSAVGTVPPGMAVIQIPEKTYATCQHRKGQNINDTYNNIFEWISSQGHELDKEHLTHLEEYPAEADPYSTDPEFTIMIPIRD